jgi:hypothetical protein
LLINQANIERTVVAPRRLDADNILKGLPGGGVAWAADYMRVHRYAEGGGQSIKIHKIPPNDSRNMLFTSSDASSVLRFVAIFQFGNYVDSICAALGKITCGMQRTSLRLHTQKLSSSSRSIKASHVRSME